VTASILAAALEADLLAMGRIGRPISSRSHLGSSARAAMGGTGGSVLVMKQGGHLHYPVLVTFDGSAAARQALKAAAQLAQSGSANLNVLLLGKVEERPDLEQEAAALLEKMGVNISFHGMADMSVAKLVAMIETADDCVLVLGGDNPLLEADNIQELLDRTDCPVMLVR
jgi:nucleotide-binding universal stress UspA family protein